MEILVERLRDLEASELPTPEHVDDVYLEAKMHALVEKIEALASDVLVSEGGQPNFNQMDKLFAMYGYFVFPGDRDRFGWVTGCLRTKKGIIVFG